MNEEVLGTELENVETMDEVVTEGADPREGTTAEVADTSGEAPVEEPTVSPVAALMNSLLFPVAIILIFYFVIIKPQKKREKETRAMLSALEVGQEVISIGGIVGKICKIKDDVITLEVGADKVKLQFERSAIRNVKS